MIVPGTPSKQAEPARPGAGGPAAARNPRPRRARRRVRIPSCARYEAYMQELAADCQRRVRLGSEEGA